MSEKRIDTPTALGVKLARAGKEAGLVLAIGCNLFVLLAIFSYDARDPGWSHLGYQSQVSNLAGITGAWIADVAISMLGVGAYLVPLLVIWPAVRFLRRRGEGVLDAIPYIMLRTTGAVLMLVALASLASMHISNEVLKYPFTAGGLVGQALSDLSVIWLSLAGGSVVHWTLMLFGLTLYADISWRVGLEACGGLLLQSWERVSALFVRNADTRHEVREHSEEPVARPKKPLSPHTSADTRHEARVEPTRASRESEATIRSRTQPMPEMADQDGRLEPSFSFGDLGGADADPSEQDSPPWKDSYAETEAANVSQHESSSGAEDPVAQMGSSRRGLKIVPLSESHKPLVDDEPMEAKSTELPRKPKHVLPSLDLLDPPELQTEQGYSEDELEEMSRLLEQKLKDFGVIAEVVEVNPGPVITRFELQPAPGVKASKISNLARDLARSMAVSAVRVVEVIPGKSVVGIEIPNASRQTVRLSEVLNAKPYLEAGSRLTLALGNDIAGNPMVANLAKMPHLLVAGTTGSGKSVGVNAMLLSLLFKATPDEVRLMLVDPKMLELSIYDGIPHLLTPVITDMKEAAGGLRWCVAEMERRYRLMAKMGVRNIAGFNEKLVQAQQRGETVPDPLWNPQEMGFDPDEPAPALETLPYIVVVIDEFADMMMMVGKKVEELIARIAQKARAAGIHLILATQRPSVDVITGLIKANIPTRIAFQVSSKIDSRTILDQSGAENLLGYGDMLYLPAGTSVPNRVHGAFVSDDEVHRTVEAWRAMGEPVYIDDILNDPGGEGGAGGGSGNLFDDEADPLYDEAVAFVTESRKASISSVQRKLKIGYNRAARMIESMEMAGVITEAGTNGQREVLAPPPPRD
ncbi:DNA translocase FtsK [Marinobacterium zhoushanense]|uniref:DNA translocase FtsK n=1 Tax=Marinobacterium zhoushanense TaxID=1679163 RepID=A0ABQ1KCC5_9GAMM|nr:DNA translocase FtsK [Marinobacterium zhoushanense]GGB90884.1 DNA translocase FtsK [Marinobacterium zhoushanense]